MKKIVAIFCSVLIAVGILWGTVSSEAYATQENVSETEEEDGVFTEEDLEWIREAKDALADILSEHSVMALVYLSDEYSVRSEASESSDVVVNVPS